VAVHSLPGSGNSELRTGEVRHLQVALAQEAEGVRTFSLFSSSTSSYFYLNLYLPSTVCGKAGGTSRLLHLL
jgi:hypothetical protein